MKQGFEIQINIQINFERGKQVRGVKERFKKNYGIKLIGFNI